MNIALNIIHSGFHNCTREAESPNTRSRNDPMEDKVFAEDVSTMHSSPVNQNENLKRNRRINSTEKFSVLLVKIR